MTRKQRRRAKKAALLAAFCYICVLTGGVGMLRAAQRTRQILYGGQPAMAELRTPEGTGGQVALGGGEWEIPLPDLSAQESDAAELAAKLPPCTLKYLVRLTALADRAADYTARCIRGSSASSFSLRS